MMNGRGRANRGYSGRNNYVYGREARLSRIRQRRRRAAMRRRVCMAAAMLALGLMLGMALTGFSRITVRKAPTYKYYTAVTVRADDTLWGIAQEHMTEEYSSIHAYMKEIQEVNSMKSDKIYYGQKLILPYYSSEQR